MATFKGPSLGPDGWLRDKHLPPNLRDGNIQPFLASEAADPDSPLHGELSATILDKIKTDGVPKWKATTAYLAGDKVLSPAGDVVSAKVNFTSGASYSAANWDLSANLAGKLDKTEAATTYATPASVPPLVASALATDPTPANAAAAAVATKLTEAGVLSGAHPILADDTIAFSITGAGNRRSWIEIGQDGAPTTQAATVIAKKSAPIIQSEGLLPIPQTINNGAGLAYVLVDSAGRKSELQIGLDGKLTGPFPDRILAAAVTAASDVGLALPPLPCWGDSLTEGGWPATLATELGITTRNFGIGGQGVASIAARQGGKPALVVLPSNTIPATGPVTLTSISAIPYSNASGTGTSSGHGKLAGVAGTLSRDNTTGVHTFTRDASGSATWAAPSTPWVPDEAPANASQMAIIWSGRNSFTTMTPDAIVAIIKAMVTYMDAPRKRFLVLEIPPWVGEESVPSPTANRVKLDALNAALLDAFPNEFVPAAQYLRGPALADLGLTPTTQDNTDIANGLTPTQLRGDGGHPNTQGHIAIGKYLAKVIQQKGWKLS